MWALFSVVASAGVTVQSSGTVYPTLTEAVAAAIPGDTLTLDAGIHPDLVTITDDVTLVGVGAVLTGCEESSIVVEQDVALTVTGLTFDSACRGIILLGGNTLVATDVTFAGHSVYEGGGVRADDPLSLEFVGGTMASTADENGGGLSVTSTTLAPVTLTGVRLEGVAGTGWMGGSIYASGVELVVADSTFVGGSATYGGGIFVEGGELTVTDSTFEGVSATLGAGAIGFDNMSAVQVVRSTFCLASVTDAAGFGGAIGGAQVTGPVVVRNSTFVESTAALGPALYGFEGTWTVENVTIVGSTGTGAIYMEPAAVLDGSSTAITDSSDWGLYVAAGAASQSRLTDGLTFDNVPGNATGFSMVSGAQGDPGFVAWSQDQDCGNDVLWPAYGSPLLDRGDPAVLDPDGSPADIGATGGPDADPALWADDDGDGGPNVLDCDPADPTVYVGAPEVCDGADQDCDGNVDELAVDAPEWWLDCDGDGQGEAAPGFARCEPYPGDPCAWSNVVGTDCDDLDPTVYAGAPELCAAGDQDCGGDGDAGAVDALTWYDDVDADGYGGLARVECVQPPGTITTGGDCDDAAAATFPGAPDPCGDAVDQDCNGADGDDASLLDWVPDADGDGFGDASAPVESTCADLSATHVPPALALDCDDGDAARHPGATEVCNGADDDCDGLFDDTGADRRWYPDDDGDGYGGEAGAITSPCPPTSDVWLTTGGDCDDTTDAVNPEGVETCNGADDDCDGATDAADDGTIGLVDGWPDADGDGFGGCPDSECGPTPVCDSDLGAGWQDSHSDCDDADAAVNPAASEVAGNAVDEDCDGAAAKGPGADEEGGGCGCGHAGPNGWIFAIGLLGLCRRR